MTDKLFHEIPDAQVILRSKGVYRQAKLFRRGEDVFAAWGSGFIRLLSAGGTTVPTVHYLDFDAASSVRFAAGKLGAPKWCGL